MELKINDNVRFHSTSDPNLDGRTGMIGGMFGEYIVMVGLVNGDEYNGNWIVAIPRFCLEKI